MAKGGGNRKEETNEDKNEKYFDFFFSFLSLFFLVSGKQRVELKLFWRENCERDEMSSFARTRDNSIIDERLMPSKLKG